MVSEDSEYSIYRRVVSQLMQGQEQLPSLPSLTLEIRRALTSGQLGAAALARLVGRDPALSALLMKHASCALYRQPIVPKTLQDVIALLGTGEVDRITMQHSIKSLFTLHSPAHKQLFMEAWRRQMLKAATCATLARLLGRVPAGHALLACLLAEVGTLAVLSAFKDAQQIPSLELYYKLCREYSKSLGVIVLKKWSVDDQYITVVRAAGDWQSSDGLALGLIDLVNLALFHAIRERNGQADLPPLATLAAYRKLTPPQSQIGENDQLELFIQHRTQIQEMAESLS